MTDKITVGVFWVCDEGGSMGVIYDKETYSPDWQSDFGDEFIIYEKGHCEVWGKLSRKFFGGKYSNYLYDDFPRGRVTYDKEEGVYMIDFDGKLKAKFSAIKAKIYSLFGLEKAVWQVDNHYKSTKGRFNA
ncbi:MAG: hypothetical protein IJX88_02730 [Clostridia bacterium]|nr:hypothetical protein [Clostridia bacterium]